MGQSFGSYLYCRWKGVLVICSTVYFLQQSSVPTGKWLLQDVPLLVADIQDRPAVNNIVGQAKVVLATNGPYARLGTPVVEACIEERTHYCDITGTKHK